MDIQSDAKTTNADKTCHMLREKNATFCTSTSIILTRRQNNTITISSILHLQILSVDIRKVKQLVYKYM